MTDLKKRAHLSLDAVNEKVDLVTEIDQVRNDNNKLRELLGLAIMQIDNDKWIKPEALRKQQRIDKFITRYKRLLQK